MKKYITFAGIFFVFSLRLLAFYDYVFALPECFISDISEVTAKMLAWLNSWMLTLRSRYVFIQLSFSDLNR